MAVTILIFIIFLWMNHLFLVKNAHVNTLACFLSYRVVASIIFYAKFHQNIDVNEKIVEYNHGRSIWPKSMLALKHSFSSEMTIQQIDTTLLFHSSHFSFLVTFGNEVTKIRKYYVIFVYILQGKMGKTEKNWKENHTTKVTKIPKTKRRKYRMNETKISH